MLTETANKINQSGKKVFFAITGGGQSFLGDFMSIAGASNTVVGAIIPYSTPMFEEFIGKPEIKSFASEEAARRLAKASFLNCLKFNCLREQSIGIGVTCSLAKLDERPDREHKVFVAVHQSKETSVYHLLLKQGRTRQEEEHLTKHLIVHVLEKATLGDTHLRQAFSLLVDRNKGEKFSRSTWENTVAHSLLTNTLDAAWSMKDGCLEKLGQQPIVAIYSGSWNPIHNGHKQIYQISSEVLGTPPIMELSLVNVDKGEIDYIDLHKRLSQLREYRYPYVLTTAPTFVDKARLFHKKFPNSKVIFVVGQDTWARIWDEKYAGPTSTVFNRFVAYDSHFLVFPRGSYTHVNIPRYADALRVKSKIVDDFNCQISSSDIRKTQ